MTWNYAAVWAKEVLGLILVVRLLTLRLQRVYLVFSVFLAYELSGSLIALELFKVVKIDYRVLWLILSPIGWVLTLWMVYALLEAVLSHLPGILRFSRRLLHYLFIGAALASLISGRLELASAFPGRDPSLLAWAVSVGVVLERVIFTIALIVLIAIIIFVLWFAVEIPRNLILFCFGLVVYLSSRNAVLIAETLWGDRISWLAGVSTVILAGCFVYWALCITAEGEYAVRVAIRERPGDHERLLGQLESMNAALLRGVRH